DLGTEERALVDAVLQQVGDGRRGANPQVRPQAEPLFPGSPHSRKVYVSSGDGARRTAVAGFDFDQLSRKLAQPLSRRGALKAAGVALGGAVAATVLRPLRGSATAPPCAAEGQESCGGTCCVPGTRCLDAANSRCSCPPGTVACGASCCTSTCSSSGTSCCCP